MCFRLTQALEAVRVPCMFEGEIATSMSLDWLKLYASQGDVQGEGGDDVGEGRGDDEGRCD